MKTVVVRYQVKPEAASQNEELIRQVPDATMSAFGRSFSGTTAYALPDQVGLPWPSVRPLGGRFVGLKCGEN